MVRVCRSQPRASAKAPIACSMISRGIRAPSRITPFALRTASANGPAQVSPNNEQALSPPEDDSTGNRHPRREPGVRAAEPGSGGRSPPHVVLLDVGDGHDGGRLREGFGLVLGADALDVVAAALGEARG